MAHSDDDVHLVFATTLVLGGVIKTVDREDLDVSPDEIENLFMHWMARNLLEGNPSQPPESAPGLEESTRFGNLAEEVSRNRRFFVTEGGRIGLGPICMSPGASIYLIYGLRTPFVIEEG